jgi:hypothetical protein
LANVHPLHFGAAVRRLTPREASRAVALGLCLGVAGGLVVAVIISANPSRPAIESVASTLGCVSFGKGGDQCGGRGGQVGSTADLNANCSNFGKAGRLCFAGRAPARDAAPLGASN